MRIRALLVAATLLVAASCESGTGPGTPDAGQFHASVSGQVDADYTGTAFIYEGNSFVPGRYIVLTSSDGAEIMIRAGGLLGGSDFDFQEGRHTVGLLSNVAADLTTSSASTIGALYIATEGTLRVTASSAERITGEFDFDAVWVETNQTTRRVQVRGEFHAVPGPSLDGARYAPRTPRLPGS